MQPDTWGMVQETPSDIGERLEKIEPTRPQTDQNDILYVHNIDIGCSDITYDTLRMTEKWRDPDPESRRHIVTRFRDVTNKYDHSKGFTAKLSNHPFTIPPNGTMRLPRYIGQHYAEKLADHMLDKMGVDKMKRNDPIERPAMLARIIVKIEPFMALMPETVGDRAAQEVAALNPSVKPFVDDTSKQGEMPELSEAEVNPTDMKVVEGLGNLRVNDIEPTEDVIKRLPEMPEDAVNVPDRWQATSKAEIIQLIRNMVPDFKFGSNLTKSQLIGTLERM
jgi:hypothetical protein